jgi:hypothetical protein
MHVGVYHRRMERAGGETAGRKVLDMCALNDLIFLLFSGFVCCRQDLPEEPRSHCDGRMMWPTERLRILHNPLRLAKVTATDKRRSLQTFHAIGKRRRSAAAAAAATTTAIYRCFL